MSTLELIGFVVGWIASAIIIVSFIPQNIKVIKAKSAAGVSKISFPLLLFGALFWVMYSLFSTEINWQAGVTNLLLAFSLLPTLYFLFKGTRMFIFYLFLILILLAAIMVLFIFHKNLPDNNQLILWFFVIFAGCLTGTSFIPQTIKMIITRLIGKISVLSLIVFTFANILWVIFWIITIYINNSSSDYLALSWTVLLIISNVPTIIIFAKNKSSK